MTRKAALFAAVWLLGAGSAFAQPDKPVNFNFGAGFTFALSDVRDHLGDGYNINAGITINLTDALGFQAEYGFNGLGEKRVQIPVYPSPVPPNTPTDRDFFANANMQSGTFNLVFRPALEGPIRPYVVAGPGVYYRPVQVTTPGVGYIPGWCDPWWYVCYPGGFVPVENIIGERSSTDFGMDFGGGVKFGAFFADARFHYSWGPEVEEQVATLPSTTAIDSGDRKANGQFLTLTFGIRF